MDKNNKEIMITAVLSNGLVVRVPMKNSEEIIAKMEENIKQQSTINEKEQDEMVFLSDLHSKYKRLFELVANLYQLIYREEIKTDINTIKEKTDELFENSPSTEYIYEGLKQLYEAFPTLYKSAVAKNYQNNAEAEQKRLQQIDDLLRISIIDLNDLIADKAEAIAERMMLDEIEDRDN